MATPILPLRVSKETRARWKAGAEDRGYADLSEFVRACVESELAPAAPKPQPGRSTRAARKETERVARTGLCPHRLGPEQFCSRCDA